MSPNIWQKNENTAMLEDIIGVCPVCGSKDTYFQKVIMVSETKRGYLKVGCRRCGSNDIADVMF